MTEKIIEKKPLFDMTRIGTTIALVILIFVCSLIFFGAWTTANSNSEKIAHINVKVLENKKDIDFERISRSTLEKNLDDFISEQRLVNDKVINKLDLLNTIVLELKYQSTNNSERKE